MECQYGWKVADRLTSLKNDLMFLKEKELDIDTLLTLNLEIDKDELIEDPYQPFSIWTKQKQKGHSKKLQDKLDELNQAIQFNMDEITQIEMQISRINDDNLQEQAIFFKNHAMLNDCKITTEFIRLETRKRAYCNIVKLVIPKPNKDPEIVNQPGKIRNKMVEHFQEIFNKQDLNRSHDSIKDFLLLDDDTKPYTELLNR